MENLPMTTIAASPRSAEDALRACLEAIVAEQLGAPPSEIAEIARERSRFSSFYASDVVHVHLTSGQHFKVFLKDFGSFHHPKDTMQERRDRELIVYRDVLARAGLDTARYYGSVWDNDNGRFWLLLEFVEGLPVSHLEFEDWVAPAGWLGRMYGKLAQHPDCWRNSQVLVRHDGRFFETIAQDALRAIIDFSSDLGRRLEPIVGGYHQAVAVMTQEPQTLVHGTYRPAQIIIDHARRPIPRVCPVDWEKAALGASLYDLTFLVDGFDPPRLRQLFQAYRSGAAEYGLRVGDDQEIEHVVNCFRLHRVMNWLAVSLARRYDAQTIQKLIGMAQDVGKLVL
jgi:aminoglycoside phosphotransferase (APT) family kinase protein